MRTITRYYKRLNITYIATAVITIIVSIFFMPTFVKIENTGNNSFTVYLNDEEVGKVGSIDNVDEYMRKARVAVAKRHDEMILMEADIRVDGEEVFVGKVDSGDIVQKNMEEILEKSTKQTLNRSYTLKINEYTVNLASCDEVRQLLQASLDLYDEQKPYTVDLIMNPERELNVLTAEVKPLQADAAEKETVLTAGVETDLTEMLQNVEPAREKEFSEFELGLTDLDYEDTIEIVEAYLLEEEITPLNEAIEQVTKEQEKKQIYEVVPGDTLSLIAIKKDLTIEQIIEMNATIENELSTIRVGDEIIVTVPEPELTVVRKEEQYYEEDYDADIQYVYNDNWYTNEQVTIQEPSAGHRKVVSVLSYRNDTETGRDILKEEVVMEAVPKIVEKGTKIPPTYIKPISGGRQSSGFGRRKAPTRGASSYHKGNDWATPIGTSVVASCSGTVAKAGWGSGYGYVVYINHPDGRQTRYGHLSKVLVKPGQYVEQGQKIALSGNTGISSGPHVHFEILIGGKQVNPLKYMN